METLVNKLNNKYVIAFMVVLFLLGMLRAFRGRI